MRAIVLLCLLPVALCATPSYFSWNPRNHIGHKDDTHLKCYDQASCGCCLMQRQMGRMEMYFNKSVEGMHRMLNESKKEITDMRASRSAFSVALNNDSALTCFGPFATNRVVVYKHVFLNLGGGYNVSTGVFTAPRSGVYSFALTVYGRAPNGSTLAACANLRVNGTVVTGPTENGMHDREDSATIVVAVKLKAGDKVDVVLPAGCFLCDNSSHSNTFTGFLLYATDHHRHPHPTMM